VPNQISALLVELARRRRLISANLDPKTRTQFQTEVAEIEAKLLALGIDATGYPKHPEPRSRDR
jgi:hypothetical protein